MMNKAIILILSFWILAGTYPARGQDTTLVRGVIRSGPNRPLPNVSVSIEGSNLFPVVTDSTGEFEIRSTDRDDWLIINPASGYKPCRVYLNRRRTAEIYLTPLELSSGDDPVFLLSGEVLARDMVPSFSGPDVSRIQQSASLSLDQHLQGITPGMYVVNRSGMPGSGTVNTIRGIGSIHGTNMPLYIVDGIPMISHGLFGSNLEGYEYNGLMGINIYDISKITVYKDAAVGSLFGSKGSNGIILIETLDPSVTRTTIRVDLRTGLSLAPPNQIPQLNAGQHKTLMNEVLFTSGMAEEDIREFYPSLFFTPEDEGYRDYQHNTNWQDYIFQDATFYNLNVQVKGGDEIARYGLSFGYLNSEGILASTGYSGYNLRFVSRLNIFTWLKMDAGVSLNYNTSALKESAVVKETSPILAALAKSPLLNPYQYDIEGNELSALAEVDEIGVSNPLAIIEKYEAGNSNYNFTSHMGVEGTISRYLSLVSKFSFTYDVMREQIFQPNRGMERYYNKEAFNVSKATNNDLTSLFSNTYLRYARSIGNNHRLSSNTGLYLMNNKYQMDWGLTKNAHENDEYRALQDGQNNLREIGGENRLWNWLSLYENINYAFMDRYLVTVSLALDGSSRIGDQADHTLMLGGNPFGVFYSGGVAWRASGEPFLRDLSWLEELKIRFTAGISGNDDIGESNATNYYQSVKYRETVGLYPALLTNDRLTYERETMVNGGLDLAILGNRFRFSADYFVSTTHDMLIYTPVEAYFGYDYLIENGGTMRNRGLELGAFLRLIDGASFKWDMNASLSTTENQVTYVKGDKLVYSVPGAEKVNQTGAPANSFYGLVYSGVFSTQMEADAAGLVNDRGIPFNAGDAIYEDLSGPAGTPDGVINGYDKTVIGNPLPNYYGSVINSFTFKGWTLSASLQVVHGNEVFNYVRYQNEKMTGLENQSQHVLNRWQYDGQETDVPRALWEDPVGNSDFSTRWIEDGSHLRVKFIRLSYATNKEFLAFKNAEFYVSANNIFTRSSYLGYDPEFAYSFSQLYQGIDYGLTPIPRQFIAGITFGL
jgi:TonB-linked SusC/RagA family outer membrane protein